MPDPHTESSAFMLACNRIRCKQSDGKGGALRTVKMSAGRKLSPTPVEEYEHNEKGVT